MPFVQIGQSNESFLGFSIDPMLALSIVFILVVICLGAMFYFGAIGSKESDVKERFVDYIDQIESEMEEIGERLLRDGILEVDERIKVFTGSTEEELNLQWKSFKKTKTKKSDYSTDGPHRIQKKKIFKTQTELQIKVWYHSYAVVYGKENLYSHAKHELNEKRKLMLNVQKVLSGLNSGEIKLESLKDTQEYKKIMMA